jgi:hypothetical protein
VAKVVEEEMICKHLECECESSDHRTTLSLVEDGDDMLFVETHLSNFGFWKRLRHAIRYIFGGKSAYGDFQEYIWSEVQAKEFKEFVDNWLEIRDAFKEK